MANWLVHLAARRQSLVQINTEQKVIKISLRKKTSIMDLSDISVLQSVKETKQIKMSRSTLKITLTRKRLCNSACCVPLLKDKKKGQF
jgi:hypothetical protein